MKTTTQADLQERYHYAPETGVFTWRHTGLPAGTQNKKGYRLLRVGEQLVVASRVAWCYMTGVWPERNVVFIDGNKANCAWVNLRLAEDQHQVTQARLREVFDYDPDTGLLTYRRNRGGCRLKGEVAGFICRRSKSHGGGYRLVGLNGREYGAHRLIWVWWYGREAEGHVDHVNMARDDNRIKNLRECTRTLNLANRKLQPNNTSGFKGVSKSATPGKWTAHQGKKHLGTFNTPEAAHEAYVAASLAAYGEFARFS